MRKTQQSLINLIPIQSLLARDQINRKEADALLKIWNGSTDQYGRHVIPQDVDSLAVSALMAKGLIKSTTVGHVVGHNQMSSVELTRQGQNIIRDLVLKNEQSVFEKPVNKTASNWFMRTK